MPRTTANPPTRPVLVLGTGPSMRGWKFERRWKWWSSMVAINGAIQHVEMSAGERVVWAYMDADVFDVWRLPEKTARAVDKIDNGFFARRGGGLWDAGCRYTFPLVMEWVVSRTDAEIYLVGVDQAGDNYRAGTPCPETRWMEENQYLDMIKRRGKWKFINNPQHLHGAKIMLDAEKKGLQR